MNADVAVPRGDKEGKSYDFTSIIRARNRMSSILTYLLDKLSLQK